MQYSNITLYLTLYTNILVLYPVLYPARVPGYDTVLVYARMLC